MHMCRLHEQASEHELDQLVVIAISILQIHCVAKVLKLWYGLTVHVTQGLRIMVNLLQKSKNCGLARIVWTQLMRVSACCPVGQAVCTLGQYTEFVVVYQSADASMTQRCKRHVLVRMRLI